MTSFGVWGLPQMVHKFYAVKDDEAIRRGTIISTLLLYNRDKYIFYRFLGSLFL